MPRIDLFDEVKLDPTLDFSSVQQGHCGETVVRSIFLTGATGFLGVYLLGELLQQTEATIYCLVRSRDEEAGMARLQNKLTATGLWDGTLRTRIRPVIGDLGEPLFGLSPAQFDQLAQQVDVIYHNGAIVNFLQPYRSFQGANVLGTQEIIRLATQDRCKPIHYVSTAFVFGTEQQRNGQIVYEEDELGDGNRLLLGYFQSKWVAEKILGLARARGLPVYIYRPGVLIGDSRTGSWDNPDDFLCRTIKGCLQLGAWPTLDGSLSLTPVDYVGRAIVHLALHAAGPRTIFHLVNPHPLAFHHLFEWIASLGYPLQALPLKEWQTKLKREVTKPQDNALAVLIPILAKRRATAEPETLPDLFAQGRIPQVDCQNALAGLAGSDIACPPLTREHFRAYVEYFIRTGFLEAPPDLLR
jgi:thioester reductase-like protein